MLQKKINFIKTDSLGNDFVIIDARAHNEQISLTADMVRTLAARVHPQTYGCDQLIVIFPTNNDTAIHIETYNADGSMAEACGNGTRVIAALTQASEIQTESGVLHPVYASPKLTDGHIGIMFAPPRMGWRDIPLRMASNTHSLILDDNLPPAFAVNVGNPHVVMFFDNAVSLDELSALAEKYGASCETHPMFPRRANINFAHILDAHNVNYRTWERGAGLTQACGTGAAATAIAMLETRKTQGMVYLNAPNGQIMIDYHGVDASFMMAGPVPRASDIHRGTLDDGFIADIFRPLSAAQ